MNNTSAVEGRYFSVICNATSNPSAKYKWTDSSGQIVSSTRILVFPTIQRDDAATYSCTANNSAGLETKSSLTIDVQCELDLPPLFLSLVCYVVCCMY